MVVNLHALAGHGVLDVPEAINKVGLLSRELVGSADDNLVVLLSFLAKVALEDGLGVLPRAELRAAVPRPVHDRAASVEALSV